MASASIPAQPGETIAGKYQIERVIGTGGVGMVVAARHLTLAQTVALKFLLPGAAHDRNDVLRFQREAQTAVQLRNEHVARVYDVGELDDGSPFMVLEYLDGQDLGHVLHSHGPLPIVEAVGYLLQVCEAVAEAHSIGMVHRDLKPSNFFLTHRRDGFPLVKVLDFGIAKYKIELEQQDVSLTQTRALLGSPVYMSPEQVRSARSVDHRSDIWSLGVCLFELLTDTVPFGGETVTGVAAAVSSDPIPPVARYRPDVPSGLVTVIERCLAKRPQDRYQSIADLAEALVPFGPADSPYCLYRISGTLGIRQRTADTNRGAAATSVAGTTFDFRDPTQISTTGEEKSSAKGGHKRLYWTVGAVSVIALGVVGLIAAKRTESSDIVPVSSAAARAASASVAVAGSAPKIVVSPVPAAEAVPDTAAPARVGPVTLATASRTRSHPAGSAATVNRIATPGKKSGSYKSPGGGPFEDIVDTRH